MGSSDYDRTNIWASNVKLKWNPKRKRLPHEYELMKLKNFLDLVTQRKKSRR